MLNQALQLMREAPAFLSPQLRRQWMRSSVSQQPTPPYIARQVNAELEQRGFCEAAPARLGEAAALYTACYDVEASFALRPTVAFTLQPEFTVVALKDIPSGALLTGLSGILLPVGPVTDVLSPNSKRSMVASGKDKQDMRFVGS